MNTNTHDGGKDANLTGKNSWPQGYFNFDDSPISTECFPSNGRVTGAEIYCEEGHNAASAASQAAYLPAGHSLSYVLHQWGTGGMCHVSHPGLNESPDETYCIRYYRRWDPGTEWPHPATGLDMQQKIATIGAAQDSNSNSVLNAQISLTHNGIDNSVGVIHTRFDGYMFNSDGGQFQNDIGDAKTQCVNNFCRFEVCLDYRADGHGRVRHRRTGIAPGAGFGQQTNTAPFGDVAVPKIQSFYGGPNGVSLYTQDMYAETYNTHFIVTRIRPMDTAFWPGPACEVEGECSGAPPAPFPSSPTLLILQ